MQYRHVISGPSDATAVKGVGRAAAFAIDVALAIAVSLVVEQEKFGGLPAAVFLLGIYRLLAHGMFKRTVGKAVMRTIVDDHVQLGARLAARAWWRRCLFRELPFYGLPGLILAGQLLLELELSPTAEGWLLIILVGTLGVELLLLAGDAAVASVSEDGRSLHDRLAGTIVRRAIRAA